jgi:CSLREA domain-containing protein
MTARPHHHTLPLAAALTAIVAALVAASWGGMPATGHEPAGGLTFTVTRTDDPDPSDCEPDDCSLREAVIAANSSPGHSTIVIPAGEYILSIPTTGEDAAADGDLDLTDDVTITGAGADTTSLDAGGQVTSDRAFHVLAGVDATISGMTITGASLPVGYGGAIYNQGALTLSQVVLDQNGAGEGGGVHNKGVLNVSDSVMSGNIGVQGGAIKNEGPASLTNVILEDNEAWTSGGAVMNTASGSLVIEDSLIAGNSVSYTARLVAGTISGRGGGIYNAGELEVRDTTLSGNSSELYGGGLYNDGSAEVTGVTFSGNEAADFGAAVFNTEDGIISIANSTISGNTAQLDGGGLHNFGQARFAFTTITGNVAESGSGNGIFNPDALVEMRATILTANSDSNCAGFGTYQSTGHNISDDATCSLTEDTDLPDTDPVLGPLADNGGPTFTHALGSGSPALDGGPVTCPGVPADQRGLPRPQGDACDIGAYEGAHILWGDVDCDGAVAIGDALKTARHLLGLSVSQTDPCFTLGVGVSVDAAPQAWGDADCDATVAIGDALKVARWLLGLEVSQEPGCPEIGAEVPVLPDL